MTTKCGPYLVVVFTALTPARAAAQPADTVVRAIQIVEDGGITRVTIDAEGPLPLPRSGSLSDPPRIYFDLAGVTHNIRGTTAAQSGGVVSRVRVALHAASPKGTRVVLDLTRLESYRVDGDERQSGRIRIFVGSKSPIPPEPTRPAAVPSPAATVSANASSTSVVPSRIAVMATAVLAGNSTPAMAQRPGIAAPTPSPAISQPAPTRSPVLSPEPPRPLLPARDVEVYRKQIGVELGRMAGLRSLVARIDAGENVGSDTLASAAQQFAELRRNLEKVQPSRDLAVTHDLLMTACTYGAMASRFGIDAAQASDPQTRLRAASAAAGSLMLFDRACANLGCTRVPR